jgi:hypothetical protein
MQMATERPPGLLVLQASYTSVETRAAELYPFVIGVRRGESFWRFKHPTIGDAYAELLVQSPELLGIDIRGSAPERIVDQVTCGDVGIEKAVVLPKPLFPLILGKCTMLM